MKLGTLLIRDGVINLDQLEAALRAQVLFGGKLGTNLVELGHISLETLSEYLGRTLAVPSASQARFEAADPVAVAMLPIALAVKHIAFPLAFEGEPRQLAVALADPRDRAAIATLEQACGIPIAPYIAPELRIFFYLERHYGVERKARFLRVQRTPAAAAAGLSPTPGVSLKPRGTAAPPAPAPPRPVPLAEALAVLEGAQSRDQIAEGILRFAHGRLEATVLLLLKEGLAIGWRGFAPGIDVATLEAFALPLGAPSCLASAYDTRAAWRGKPTAAGAALDERLFTHLRLPEPPDEVITVPILIGTRVVNLLYAHAPQRGALDDGMIDGLLAVAAAAGQAYARMIQTAKARLVD